MLTVKARTKIFGSRPRFLGSRNPLRPSKTFYYQWFKSYGQGPKSAFFAFFKRKLRHDKFISWEKNFSTHILNPFPINREIIIEKF